MKTEEKKRKKKKDKKANVAMMSQAKDDRGIRQNAREGGTRLRTYVSFNGGSIAIGRFDR